jgi:hypothetical protein
MKNFVVISVEKSPGKGTISVKSVKAKSAKQLYNTMTVDGDTAIILTETVARRIALNILRITGA